MPKAPRIPRGSASIKQSVLVGRARSIKPTHQAARMQGVWAVRKDDRIILFARYPTRALGVEKIFAEVAALVLFKPRAKSGLRDRRAADHGTRAARTDNAHR